MIFEFIFSSSKPQSKIRHFIGFLKYHASLRNLKFSDAFNSASQEVNEYIFYLHSSPEEALDFAEFLGKTMPLSLVFGFREFKLSTKENLKQKRSHTQKPQFVDVAEIKEILNPDSKAFCDLGLWVKNIVFQDKAIQTKQAFIDTLKNIALGLKNHQSYIIKTPRGVKELSFVKKSSEVLFWDLSSLKSYTRTQSSQSQMLASYEKPITKLCPKEVFAELLLKSPQKCFELDAMLAYDLILSALGVFALDLEMGYVFIKNSTSKSFDLSYEHYTIPKAQRLTLSEDGFLINNALKKDSQSIFDIIRTSALLETSPSKYNHQRFILFLSQRNPTCLWIEDRGSYKEALEFSLELNPKLLIQSIQESSGVSKRLIKNFQNTFEAIFEKILALDPKSINSKNLMDLFGSAGFILGYDENLDFSSQSILNNAKKFVRDKGPRIDFKFIKKEDGSLKFDALGVIKSAMSFRIAGLDEATLSYGFIDSMAEFLGNFVRDIALNFSIENVLVCGDMLGEKIFLDKFLHYVPKNIQLIFPKEGYIDYRSNAHR